MFGGGSNSVWNTAGETLSKKHAMAQYGLTEQDLMGLPFQRRSCWGNSYPLFVRADVAAVARKKAEEKAAAEGAKLGDEEYERRQKLAASRKELAATLTQVNDLTTKQAEINAQLARLVERRQQLEATITQLGGNVEEEKPGSKKRSPAKKAGAKGKAGRAKKAKTAGDDEDADWKP